MVMVIILWWPDDHGHDHDVKMVKEPAPVVSSVGTSRSIFPARVTGQTCENDHGGDVRMKMWPMGMVALWKW